MPFAAPPREDGGTHALETALAAAAARKAVPPDGGPRAKARAVPAARRRVERPRLEELTLRVETAHVVRHVFPGVKRVTPRLACERVGHALRRVVGAELLEEPRVLGPHIAIRLSTCEAGLKVADLLVQRGLPVQGGLVEGDVDVDPLLGFVNTTDRALGGPASHLMVGLVRAATQADEVLAFLAERTDLPATCMTVVGVLSGAGVKTGYNVFKIAAPSGVVEQVLEHVGGRLVRFHDDLVRVAPAEDGVRAFAFPDELSVRIPMAGYGMPAVRVWRTFSPEVRAKIECIATTFMRNNTPRIINNPNHGPTFRPTGALTIRLVDEETRNNLVEYGAIPNADWTAEVRLPCRAPTIVTEVRGMYCHKCHKQGHVSRNCPKRNERTRPNTLGTPAPIPTTNPWTRVGRPGMPPARAATSTADKRSTTRPATHAPEPKGRTSARNPTNPRGDLTTILRAVRAANAHLSLAVKAGDFGMVEDAQAMLRVVTMALDEHGVETRDAGAEEGEISPYAQQASPTTPRKVTRRTGTGPTEARRLTSPGHHEVAQLGAHHDPRFAGRARSHPAVGLDPRYNTPCMGWDAAKDDDGTSTSTTTAYALDSGRPPGTGAEAPRVPANSATRVGMDDVDMTDGAESACESIAESEAVSVAESEASSYSTSRRRQREEEEVRKHAPYIALRRPRAAPGAAGAGKVRLAAARAVTRASAAAPAAATVPPATSTDTPAEAQLAAAAPKRRGRPPKRATAAAASAALAARAATSAPPTAERRATSPPTSPQ
jgi:hypothetical protein